MCLETLDKETKQTKYAYKVFSRDKNKLDGKYYCFNFKKRRWLKDTKNKLLQIKTKNKKYLTGFHCYLNLKDALYAVFIGGEEIVHRVIVRNIVASGMQDIYDSSQTIVAKEIFIMEEVTK